MAFCIEISDTVRFTVKGSLKDETGAEKPFSFDLVATRLDADEYADAVSAGTLRDFLLNVITGWHGLKAADGGAQDFSADALARLLKLPGMATLVFKAYSADVIVKEKN